MKHISSTQNPAVKFVNQLEKDSKFRKEQQLFVLEGIKEFAVALQNDYSPEMVFIHEKSVDEIIKKFNLNDSEIYICEQKVFSKIAYREDTEIIVAVFKQKKELLKNIQIENNSMIFVLENVEKPGNLGAILRTADATSANAVILCNNQTDIYNPNVIRSSIGCFFSIKTIVCSNEECNNWLQKNSYDIYAAMPEAEKSYHENNYSNRVAFVMGTESKGLSEFWNNVNVHGIRIPMMGKIDSLNVSVSTAILAYEFRRQKNFLL